MRFQNAVRSKAAKVACLSALLAAVSACSTSSEVKFSGKEQAFARGATFVIAETKDSSGFVFEDKSEAFKLDEAFAGALKTALAKESIPTSGVGAYTIKSEIVAYAPGNAFARWLMPGAGATELSTVSRVYAASGEEIATIPVSRSIAAGGGYTVGAYKYVFNDNAQEVALLIKARIAQ